MVITDGFSSIRYGLYVRLVIEEDAPFILKLRTDSRLNHFIHATENDLEKQVQWIREYKVRERQGKEYYFLFMGENGCKYGVSRIYNITDSSFTSGSWIFSPEAPFGAGFLGDIISREVAFELFPNKWNYFDIEKGNNNVQRYSLAFHPEVIGETETTVYYRIDRETFNRYKSRYTRFSFDR